MKKLFKGISSFVKNMKANVELAELQTAARLQAATTAASTKLQSETGTFVVEHGAVMLIILVVAAVAIVLLKSLVTDTLAPTIRDKMLEFFN